MPSGRPTIHVAQQFQPAFREIGLDAETIFIHPRIQVWRSLSDRENCTLDAVLSDGRRLRLHIKRYRPKRWPSTPGDEEARGSRALVAQGIPTATLVAWGHLPDGRSFTAFEDLAGHAPADKLIENGLPFERLLVPTASLAARLHRSGLHHRDLYLCHFFTPVDGDPKDIRLIDAARVRRLPGFLMRQRWIVKDLAQFWYSTTALPVSDDQRARWLHHYAEQRGVVATPSLRRRIERKVAWIARHDAELRTAQPGRNVSIPPQM